MKISEFKKILNDKKNKENLKYQLELDEFKLSLKDYDKKQEEILLYDGSNVLIEGPAGSGKTILAMVKLFELEEKMKNYRIVLYTITLKNFIKAKMIKAKFDNINNKIFYEQEYEQNFESDNYDYIIIDEVQDIKLEKISEYINKAKAGFFLYGDNAQQVYPERTENLNILEEIKKIHNVKNFKLVQTYRVPKKIALFAEKIDRINGGLSMKCYRNGEQLPKIIEFSNADDELMYIKNVIENEGWKDVGILLKRNSMVKEIAQKLNDIGLVVESKYKDENDHIIDNLNFESSNPKVMTYHSSKGLEFERVFIPRCNVYEDKLTNKNGKWYNYREAFFVALTRSSQSLIISYIKNDKSKYLEEFDESTYIFESR